MKLHYFHGRSALKALVMVREQHRLELFIKPVAGAWVLVALAGPNQGQPERQHCQGPWTTQSRAESALRATAGALMGEGFEPRPEDYVVWPVTAQRLARTLSFDPNRRTPNTTLDPDQFEPIG